MDTVRIEKFFIENESFSSKTLAFLQLSHKEERPKLYEISQKNQLLAFLSDQGSLYMF